jgi:hypothetical protein
MSLSLGDRWMKATQYADEVTHAAVRIRRATILGGRPDPEDIVVLRGSTEALIELAEETDD